MSRDRLELALELLKHSDWQRFEDFASAFLSTEFENLRSVASPSGDQGRDAELFNPDTDASVVLQFSVTKDWNTKIKETAKRISETLPSAKLLIYVSNQPIGAKADDLKANIRKDFGIHLDIRDKTFFLDRFIGDLRREAISERLSEDIVDPYLASRGVSKNRPSELSSIEADAAFVYLGLQWQDDEREKGLTKLSFEALVRSVLKDTTSENRMSRQDVKTKVRNLLPEHPPDMVETYTDAALKRLTKRAIRHWKKQDEFCLTYDETVKLREHLTKLERLELNLREEIEKILSEICDKKVLDRTLFEELPDRTRRILEHFLFRQSETFATALHTGHMRKIINADVDAVIIKDLSDNPVPKDFVADIPDVLSSSVHETLKSSAGPIREYLRSLSDSYTLFSFLRQTPDVQAAVEKLFSHGELWLDTNIVLPIFAEQVLDNEERRFEKMVLAARAADLSLRAIPGVIEEIERHMNLCLTYFQMPADQWQENTPYLASAYIESGRSPHTFRSWLETFRGEERPKDDIAEYLSEFWGIEQQSLEKEAETASSDLKRALQTIWEKVHKERRKRRKHEIDDMTLARLVKHDVESYVGIIQSRKQEKSSPFGYSAWWLTMDSKAFNLESKLKSWVGSNPPSSPVISADFMIN
jgi:hypothetical protein